LEVQDMNELEQQRDAFRAIVEGSDNVVFFGGAGVSTESGIPDFRSKDGLYSQKYDYPPERIISRSFFDENPEEFFRFYRDRMLFEGVEPNQAHRKLAELEQQGHVRAVVTQNIDGLHQAAGSKTVFELHGSVWRNFCMDCGEPYSLDYIIHSESLVPRCERCGGIVKPDVVLYEEPLDPKVIEQSVRAIQRADVLVVAGTSLVVYPAASFLGYFRGDHLIVINRTPTPIDRKAELCIQGDVGKVFSW
jgi:NAD-dependent deacetylase